MYIIETKRLGLRNWIDTDIPMFIEMNKDSRVMEYFPKLFTEEETIAMTERIKQHMTEKDFGFWAVEVKETNEFAGFVGLSVPRFEADFTPCVEIGWRLAYKHWGKGYAEEAARACLDYGFNKLGLKEIVSFTSVLNTRSMNVMKKIGMKYVKEFDHPNVELGHKLRRHVLYLKSAND
jgi:3-dehydroquinate dehydratase/shikimate dehydrogenase